MASGIEKMGVIYVEKVYYRDSGDSERCSGFYPGEGRKYDAVYIEPSEEGQGFCIGKSGFKRH